MTRRTGSSRWPSSRSRRRRALTLLEIVLAMGLLVVLSSMTYWFYASALETRRNGTVRAHRLRLVRVVLDRMAREIRQASLITADKRVGIRGEPERLWLSTLRVPSKELSKVRSSRAAPPPGEYDLVKLEYKIARHPDILHTDENWELPLGLARVEIKIPRPDSAQTGKAREDDEVVVGGAEGDAAFLEQLAESEFVDEEEGEAQLEPRIEWEELYAPEIRYLRFCYYDGHSWWDKWDVSGDNPLPQLVMVTVGLSGRRALEEGELGRDEYNEEYCECLNRDIPDCLPLPANQFSRVVRVAQADSLFRSRITRETQAVMEELSREEGEDGEEGEGGR